MLRFSRVALMAAIATLAMGTGATGQGLTTAAEVKPILTATKPSWVAVREYDGQDLLYFTNLLAWRCGVTSISYALNGGAAQDLPMEPCHADTAQPNALLMDSVLPYVTLPLGSLQSLSVTVTFDDATTEQGDYLRPAILMP
jgi:hypothetical protein